MVEPVRLVDYLSKIYFDPQHPASYSGPRKLYNLVKKSRIHTILRVYQTMVARS